jgi:hypothetical protein
MLPLLVFNLVAIAAHAQEAPTPTVVGDRDVPTIQAHVTDDGRLGVRGETTTQAGVPSNAWAKSIFVPAARGGGNGGGVAELLWGAPPGSGVGLSQLSVLLDGGDVGRIWLVSTFAGPNGCATEIPVGYRAGESELVYVLGIQRQRPNDLAFTQATFPIPLTVAPAPARGVCLYVSSFGAAVTVSASGISGPPVPSFVAPLKSGPIPE